MIVCDNCGAEVSEEAQYCPNCGKPTGHANAPRQTGMQRADEVEFKVYGEDLQFVEIMLDPGELIIAEAGAMMYMDSAITMEAVFGDGSAKEQGKGLFDKLVSAGKRVISGESLFMTEFTNRAAERKAVAFAAPYPGCIIPFDLTDVGGELLCQKDAFLCAAHGISIGIAFNKKVGVGLFGGEGFIMEKLEGDGLAFMHAGGTILKKNLAAGETLKLDTGCLVALETTVNYDIEFSKDIKTALFSGEGIVLATLTGPGAVWVQSLPFSRLADRIISASHISSSSSSSSKGEGSVLGGLSNLFEDR